MASLLWSVHFAGIAPILSVGCYFEAFRPTNVTLVTLVWFCITFWNILTSSSRKMLVSWSWTGKPWSAQTHFVFVCVPVPVCACMCIVCVRHCVRGAPFDHNSAYRHHCMLHIFCSECSHGFHSITACYVSKSVLGLLLSNCWPCCKFLKCGTTCQRALYLCPCITCPSGRSGNTQV